MHILFNAFIVLKTTQQYLFFTLIGKLTPFNKPLKKTDFTVLPIFYKRLFFIKGL